MKISDNDVIKTAENAGWRVSRGKGTVTFFLEINETQGFEKPSFGFSAAANCLYENAIDALSEEAVRHEINAWIKLMMNRWNPDGTLSFSDFSRMVSSDVSEIEDRASVLLSEMLTLQGRGMYEERKRQYLNIFQKRGWETGTFSLHGAAGYNFSFPSPCKVTGAFSESLTFSIGAKNAESFCRNLEAKIDTVHSTEWKKLINYWTDEALEDWRNEREENQMLDGVSDTIIKCIHAFEKELDSAYGEIYTILQTQQDN